MLEEEASKLLRRSGGAVCTFDRFLKFDSICRCNLKSRETAFLLCSLSVSLNAFILLLRQAGPWKYLLDPTAGSPSIPLLSLSRMVAQVTACNSYLHSIRLLHSYTASENSSCIITQHNRAFLDYIVNSQFPTSFRDSAVASAFHSRPDVVEILNTVHNSDLSHGYRNLKIGKATYSYLRRCSSRLLFITFH